MVFKQTVKLKFIIDFKKCVVGKENQFYTKDFKPECCECGYDMKNGEEYFVWYVADNYLDVCGAVPVVDDDEYILCQKCANKKK